MTGLTETRNSRRKIVVTAIVVAIIIISIVAVIYISLPRIGLTISLTRATVQIQRGTNQTVQVSLTGNNSPVETVSLSTSNPPSNVTATFSTANLQLTANGSVKTNLTITAGSHAYGQNSTLTITAATSGLTRQTGLTIAVVGSTSNYSMGGSYSSGWNVTTIRTTQGDILVLHLTSQDSLTHAWFLDYNGNSQPDAGEPLSPNINSPTIPESFEFLAAQTGSFHYFCKYHPNMTGMLTSIAP